MTRRSRASTSSPAPSRSAGVALFEWINGKALANTYMLLDATLDQYRALYGQADRFQPAFFQHFVGQSFADRPATVLITHSMAFVVILLALLSREFIQTRKKRRRGRRQLRLRARESRASIRVTMQASRSGGDWG